MVSWAVFILGPLWVHGLIQACRGEELSRGVVLSWFRQRVLESLGLEGPPLTRMQRPYGNMAQPEARHIHQRVRRTSRAAGVNQHTSSDKSSSQIILFPSPDSSCARSDSASSETNSHFTFYFQPSINSQDTAVMSAHFWFYAGEGATVNSSAPLFILTSTRSLQAAEAPSTSSSDGWTTYHLEETLLATVAEGPFLLQVRCPDCQCNTTQQDKMPFLNLHVQPRSLDRSPRRAAVTIPWSPSAIYLLQRPSQERPEHSDCSRAEVGISFEELGWDNWIVHPKVVNFYYCHGNCSAEDRTASLLGITQCCAPVPGTMKSLKITTTSDGGYSFKYETLPNIIPEECACI